MMQSNRKKYRTILYFSDVNSFSRSQARLRALADLGHTVLCIPSGEIAGDRVDYVERTYLRKIIDRIAPSFARRTWQNSLAALLTEVKPDIFWAEKPVSLSKSSTRQLRKLFAKSKFIMFSEDDLWLPHNRSKYLSDSLAEYDIVFTTKRRNVENRELEQLGARRVCFVTQAFDPYQHYPQQLFLGDRDRFGSSVGFIGSYEIERATSIFRLAEIGADVRVWGNGWPQFQDTKARIEGVPVFNSVRGLDYSKAISATDINLGFLRRRNRDTHTSRTFEIPACGGFLLAEYSEEHVSLFVPDVEAVFFTSDDELMEKARLYLRSPNARSKIARAGLDRCRKDYTSRRQMTRAMMAIESI